MSLAVRAMCHADLGDVFALQCEAYPSLYHEPVEALRAHFESGVDTSLVAYQGGVLAAYVLAHPWRGIPPVLHEPAVVPEGCDHLFIHDLAVSPLYRGRGAALELLEALRARVLARGWRQLRLVSLRSAEGFWRRHGFLPKPSEMPPACYGEALIMQCGLQ